MFLISFAFISVTLHYTHTNLLRAGLPAGHHAGISFTELSKNVFCTVHPSVPNFTFTSTGM